LLDTELDALPLLEVTEAFAPDSRVVNKDVSALCTFNETITFGSVEPLDSSSFSFRHVPTFREVSQEEGTTGGHIKKAPRLVSLGAHPVVIEPEPYFILHTYYTGSFENCQVPL
jgi:hypothetical protein